jgi:hypothetical protein
LDSKLTCISKGAVLRRLSGSPCMSSTPLGGSLLTPFRYQSESDARHFSTIGYLIPIMSILTLPVAPRARFFQNLVVTMVLTHSKPRNGFIKANLVCRTASNLFRNCNLLFINVVCYPGSSEYNSYSGGKEWWPCRWCCYQSVQCRCQR